MIKYKTISKMLVCCILLTAFALQTAIPALAAPEAPPTLFMPILTGGAAPPPSPGSWQMAGSNPERTSWTAEEASGSLRPLWYKPFEPYILPRVQIITANNLLYISTAKGLYALDAETGAQRWVYPTEMPLGHSPTIYNGVAYVGGFDHKLHAVNALTGQGLWTYQAGASFETNPLGVNGVVYLGNRDGYLYAIHASGPLAGQLYWRYQTGGPVLFSAAYKDGVVFFASNDGYAYALNASGGGLVWKSAKLNGAGFQSFWPVVYRDRVIFAGSTNYRTYEPGLHTTLSNIDKVEVYPHYATDPRGTLIGSRGTVSGDWVAGTVTINDSRALDYLTQKPWRRTYFVLDRFTGQEREVAPVLWAGTHSGNRFPPVVGYDGVIYQQNNYMSDPFIAGGQISGWKIGTPYISIITSDWGAVDEPHAYAAGGKFIYWNLCCDRQAGGINISIPNTSFPTRDGNRDQIYFSYDLQNKAPGYNQLSYNYIDKNGYGAATMVYGSPNGVYGYHGDQNPPIPYLGKLYMHRSNVVMAFAATSNPVTALPMAQIQPVQNANLTPPTTDGLKSMLAVEVQKIVNAGHLQPGYNTEGLFNSRSSDCGDDLPDYFHHPGDIHVTLLRALPYLSATLQSQVRTYLQAEFTAYPPYSYNHIGWRDGAPRDTLTRPPEFESDRVNYPPEPAIYTNFDGWAFAPHQFYAMWKFAQEFGNATAIFDAAKNKLAPMPSDNYLLTNPHLHNAFIVGYQGYLNLQSLAGYTESAQVQSQLNHMMSLRDSGFSTFTFPDPTDYCRALTPAMNFMYMTPELASFLRQNDLTNVQNAVQTYATIAPYWFSPRIAVVFGEGIIQPLYTSAAIFQARAKILNESRAQLYKYLDVPAFPVGDLFYIDKLVSLIEAP